jgi:hypothetical protein
MSNKIQLFALVAIMLSVGIYACQKTNNNESVDSKTVTAEGTTWVKESPDNFSISDAKSYLQAKITLAEGNKGSFLDKYKFSDLKVKFDEAKCYKKGELLYLVAPFTLDGKDFIMSHEKENVLSKYDKGSNARLMFVRNNEGVFQVNVMSYTADDKLNYDVFEMDKRITNPNQSCQEMYFTLRGHINNGWVHTDGKITNKIAEQLDDNTLKTRACYNQTQNVLYLQYSYAPAYPQNGFFYSTVEATRNVVVCDIDFSGTNANGSTNSNSYNYNCTYCYGPGGGGPTTSGSSTAFTGKTLTAREKLCQNSLNITRDANGAFVTKFKGMHLGLMGMDGQNAQPSLGFITISSAISPIDQEYFILGVRNTYAQIHTQVQSFVRDNNITSVALNSETQKPFPGNTDVQEFCQSLFDGLFSRNAKINWSCLPCKLC